VVCALVVVLAPASLAAAASAPPTPANVTATATSGSTIHVSWANVSGAGFVIVNGNTTRTVAAGTTSYNWAGLANGTYMCFAVAATNSAGQSAYSPYACATTLVPTPTNLRVTATQTYEFHISWTDTSGGAAGFLLTNGNSTETTTPGVTSSDWTDISMSPGTYMCFAIAATQGQGQSSWTPWVCATTLVPTPQVWVKATSATSIHVDWNEAGLGEDFLLTNGNTTVYSGVNTDNYDWTGLAPNSYMCVAVLAEEGYGQSDWSDWACTTTPAAGADDYVNVGDSFSSGEGTFAPYLTGTNYPGTNMCHRSPNSYSGQYAANSTVHPAVKNVACSGADTDDLTTRPGEANSMGIATEGEPAQVSGLSAYTKLVTVTLGINNLNLVGLATGCYQLFARVLIDPCFLNTFSDSFIAGIGGRLSGPLSRAYQAIRDHAPNAKVVVLTYP
jgi:hypothetical protein